MTGLQHRRFRPLAGAFFGALIALSGATPALATAPVDLDSGYVTDTADVLTSSEEQTANERLQELSADTGVDLFVVYVDDFTNPDDRIEWANETADRAGLGTSQYLLAVSVVGRNYYISGYTDGELSENQISAVEEQVQPQLSREDWLGAIATAAAEIESQKGAAGRTALIAVGLVVAVGGVGGAAWGIARARKRKRAAQTVQQEIADLRRTAGSSLVAADDAVKTSEQELEFARAQFGDASITQFAQALTDAQAKLSQAFALQQKLDDGIPDTEAQQREWLQQIIGLCRSADEDLDAQQASFDELRGIERDPQAALQAAQQQLAAFDAASPASLLAALRAEYADEELSGIADTPEQTGTRLEFARSALAQAEAVLAAGNGSQAAVTIRDAQAAIAQAGTLRDALTSQRAKLEEVVRQCEALLTELATDVATARSSGDASGQAAAVAAEVSSQIEAARADLTTAPRRPGRALQVLEQANARIDAAIDAAQQNARSQQLLSAQMARASELVAQAEQYIISRRGGIAATARTRAAEARAALAQATALQHSDPHAALSEAQRASSLATQALSLAQQDTDIFGGGLGGGLGGGISGGGSRSGGSGALEAIIGGVIGGLISSGGGSRGGWGGGSRGGGFGGGSRGGGFGGGGGRRSSGGGRF